MPVFLSIRADLLKIKFQFRIVIQNETFCGHSPPSQFRKITLLISLTTIRT